MPLATHINGKVVGSSVAKLRSEIYQQMKLLLEARLANLELQEQQIAKDKQRIQEYLRTLAQL